MTKKEQIRVIVKEPFYPAKLEIIDNTLEALQRIVGGYIETVTVAPAADLVIICNEEGRLIGLPYNCDISGQGFVGTVILAGVDGEEFTDVPEKFAKIVGFYNMNL